MTKNCRGLWTPTLALIILASLFLGSFSVGLNNGVSLYAGQMGFSSAAAGALVAAFTASASVSRIVSGPIIDERGKKRLFFFGTILMCLGCAIPIAAQGFSALLAARVVQGMGFSIATTVLVVMTAEAVPPNYLARGMGYRGLGVALATAIGPSLAIVFIEAGGGFALFLGFGLMTVLSMAMIALSKSRPGPARDAEKHVSDDASNGRIATHSAELQARVDGQDSRNGRRMPSRAFRLAKYFEPAVFASALVEFCRRMLTGICTSFIVLYAIDRGLGNPSLFFVIASGSIIACRLFGGGILDRGTVKKLLIPVFAACAVGFSCLLGYPCEATLCLAGLSYGLTEGFGSPFLNAMSMKAAPRERWGVASGNFYLAGDAGVAVGAFACGFAVDLIGYDAVLYGAIASILLATVVAAKVF